MDANDQRVNERFKEWQHCRANLRERSQHLDKVMREYVEGLAPMPAEVAAEVQELRKECDALFKRLLEAMNERTRAREQKP